MNKYSDVMFCSCDIDANNATAREAQVKSLPTFALYRNGSKIDQIVGADLSGLVKSIDKHIQ